MDNVTHTMIGLIAGEAAFEHSRREDRNAGAPSELPARVRRTALIAVAIAGSNLPDMDLLWSFRGGSANHLTYMLEHRGYTHTILGCAALALLLYACAEIWLRRRRFELSALDRALLLGTAIVTTALHLAMDYLNSYGVHPFWPADNRWRYGDSVFIVEPLYWLAAAPLFWRLESRLSRVLYLAAIAAVVAVGLATQFLSAASCAVVAIGTGALVMMRRRMPAAAASRLSVGLALCVTLVFVTAGQIAAHRAMRLTTSLFPANRADAGRALDHVLTPMPANPLCWDLWLLGEKGNRYIARRAVLSIVPAMESARACPVSLGAHTATLAPVSGEDSEGIRWLGEYQIAVPELLHYATVTCDANAFMQFARAPFAHAGPEVLLGDLRFDHGKERGSFEIRAEHPRTVSPAAENDEPPSHLNCPRAAPWIAPRADLLGLGTPLELR
jgi:inner membrane protein